MSAVLDFPVIDAAQTPVSEKPKATLKDTLLASFAAERPGMVALAAKYANVAYPVTTTKGLADARAARHDLRENGRFMLQRTLESLKKQANDLKKLAETETDALIALIKPVEDAIDEQIKAEEKRLADAKAEEERLENERKDKLRTAIAGIRATADRASGQPAAQIDACIQAMSKWTFPKERWAEFAVEAANACCETIEKLRQLHAAAIAPTPAPTSAPASATVTLSNGDKADSKTGEILETAPPAVAGGLTAAGAAAAEALPESSAGKADTPAQEREAAQDTTSGAAPQQASDQQQPVADAAPGGTAGPDDTPRFNVGDICGRFGRGCNLTSDFLEEVLAVPHTGKGVRGIKLWSERDVRRAAAALAALADSIATTGSAS